MVRSFVQEEVVMVLETKEVLEWRAKVTTFNFDADAVGGTMAGLLERAVELEQERVALSIEDMAVVDAATAQRLIDKATALRRLATRDPL
jgi:hypothetical protein